MNDLGDRMKLYEGMEAGRRLMPLLPALARIDGANTKHKLRELLRVEPVAAPLALGHWPENSCLCPCDVMATIAKAKKWRVDRVDEYGDVWVTPNVGAKRGGTVLRDDSA